MNTGQATETYSSQSDGGLTVTQEMKDILAKPGFIKLNDGGQRLRQLYINGSMNFQPTRLSTFGLCCCIGRIDMIKKEVEAGRAPDLEGTETPFQFGYAALVIAGAQRMRPQPDTKHVELLKYLISRGLAINVPDIVGYTALHHVVGDESIHSSVGPDSLQVVLARTLLQAGADVNCQSRYGEVPLFGAFMKGRLPEIDLLMEFGADLDIKEAEGLTPRKMMLSCGPQITAIVQKWTKRRAGEESPQVEKRCDCCGRSDAQLKNCGKCHVARYCSVECQRKAWSEHKKTCQPFSTSNTLTFKPFYDRGGSLLPFEGHLNQLFGTNTPTPETHYRIAHTPKRIDSESKKLVIKVQISFDRVANKPIPESGTFLVYTKKRDFVCQVHRRDGPAAYDQLVQLVVEKGVGSSKAYFTAELKSKDELVVKISEMLAEQPF